MEIIADRDLWDSFVCGDKQSFSILYKRYYHSMYAYGLSIGFGSDIVKDAVQDVFVKLYTNPLFEIGTNNFKCYLLRSVKYQLLDVYRTAKKTEDINNCEYTFQITFTIEDNLIDKEEAACIEQKVDKMLEILTSRQKEIIYLRYIEEMEYDEIARLMDMNVQSVRNIVCRSMEKLKSVNNDNLILLLVLFSLR